MSHVKHVADLIKVLNKHRQILPFAFCQFKLKKKTNDIIKPMSCIYNCYNKN